MSGLCSRNEYKGQHGEIIDTEGNRTSFKSVFIDAPNPWDSCWKRAILKGDR